MPKPQVTIKQPEPQVKIQMPEPMINVEQLKPVVQFQQAPPDVQVQQATAQVQVQPAQPKVQIQQVGQPKISYQQARPIRSFQASQQAQQQAQGLMSMTGNKLVGQQIVGSQGERLGEIIDMAINKQNKDVYAVVGVGGTSAGEAKGVVVPIKQIKLKQGKLIANKTKQALQQAQAYNEGQYQPIELNIPISKFASIEGK
ncbi:MAG: PRC-barrel domain-containing protein [Pseudomonadota bacterium]|nr:PRC-barrel domain-containing protein [Pseudomonadota bacterium]